MTLSVNERTQKGVQCNHPAFPAMLAIALAKGWPARFSGDLYDHDRTILERNQSTRRFVWALGESCTCLVWLDDQGRNGRSAFLGRDKATREARGIADEAPCLQFWNGFTLKEIDVATFIDLLVCDE